MHEICPLIKKWKISSLIVGTYCQNTERNHAPYIIKEIEDINFTNVKRVFLFHNNIASIEGICRIYIPTLKYLSFSKCFIILVGNEIISVSPIRKGFWPNLTGIVFRNFMINTGMNHLLEADLLSHLFCPSLNMICFEEFGDDPEQCSDVRKMMKF